VVKNRTTCCICGVARWETDRVVPTTDVRPCDPFTKERVRQADDAGHCDVLNLIRGLLERQALRCSSGAEAVGGWIQHLSSTLVGRRVVRAILLIATGISVSMAGNTPLIQCVGEYSPDRAVPHYDRGWRFLDSSLWLLEP